ncbi:MAG: hypothetical protein HYT87_18370 [Nitrospirae bacterium]|nr:hypothetical protein [Nitrospirota bacterium]
MASSLVALLIFSTSALAEEPEPVPPESTPPEVASPTPPPAPDEPRVTSHEERMQIDLHGNYWVRGQSMADANADKNEAPGAASLFEHRLLLKSRLSLEENVSLNLEAFFFQFRPWGLEGGDVTTQSSEGRHLFGTESKTSTDFGPRRGWGEVLFPNVGLFRVGRQPSDWGMGIVANDGDKPRNDFGDNRFGDTGDRILFATKPLGAEGPLLTALGFGQTVEGDVLTGSDDVLEGVLAVYFDLKPQNLKAGTYAVYRNQARTDTNLFIADFYGHAEQSVWFGEFEAAILAGQSKLFNNPDDTEAKTVSQFGGALRAGGLEKPVVPIMEVGLASGDGNLNLDRKISNFRFSPDYNVGLILFEELLPAITEDIFKRGIEKNVERPPSAANFFPTEGRVTNALYLYPRVKYYPVDSLETKFGLVWARAMKDVLNPANLLTQPTGGGNTGLRGADPSARNYGAEIDAGAEYTYSEHYRFGVQGGLAFPGDVFDVGDGLGKKVRGPDPIAKGVLRFTWEF